MPGRRAPAMPFSVPSHNYYIMTLLLLLPVVGRSSIRIMAADAFLMGGGVSARQRPAFTVASSSVRLSASTRNHEDNLVKLQKERSAASGSNSSGSAMAQQQFLKHQEKVFDDMAVYFAGEDAVPDDVVPVMRQLASRIVQQLPAQTPTEHQGQDDHTFRYRVLDVGCGTGALMRFLLEAAEEAQLKLDIVGVDLSANMVTEANNRARGWEKEYQGRHCIQALQSDFCSLILGEDYHPQESQTSISLTDGLETETTTPHRGTYHAVIANACFGNFYSPHTLLTAMAQSAQVNGMLYITHPLGANFVRKLHDEDASTVPHPLPSQHELGQLVQTQPLELADFVESFQKNDSGTTMPVYFASLRRVPHRRLSNILRLRGRVDAGYGRGGKKLGFPTANLPTSLFQNALEQVSTGVYFGYAVLETGNAKQVHKAAVNVGYSPTFEGKENPEKIVEAHLILEEPIEDFYNETMRLALIGSLRPEQKFESFPALMAAITNDVENAKAALDLELFSTFQSDPFLLDDEQEWVGASGGDNAASWEFQDATQAMEEINKTLDM